VKNKVSIVSIGGEVGQEIIKYVEKQYGRDTTDIEPIFTARKDFRSTIVKKGSEGAVFAVVMKRESESAVPIVGELSKKMLKKIKRGGATFVEIRKDPDHGLINYVHST
jgi:hypothetical protein